MNRTLAIFTLSVLLTTCGQEAAEPTESRPIAVATSSPIADVNESERLTQWLDARNEELLTMSPMLMTSLGRKDRYDEISAEMINMFQKVGWKKEFILQSTPILPISGWMGDNLIAKSTNMTWWNGIDIEVQDQKKGNEKLHIDTLFDALDQMARPPVRPLEAAMRLPVSGIYKIKGVGKKAHVGTFWS